MARPLLPLLGALMVGIVGGSRLPVPHLSVQLGLTVLLLLLWIAHRRSWPRFFSVLLLGAFALAGGLLIQAQLAPPSRGVPITAYLGTERREIEAVIVEAQPSASDRTELVLDRVSLRQGGRDIRVSGRLLVQVPGTPALARGDRVRLQTRLRAPRNFGNPGAFDYERLLHLRGIWARGFIPEPGGVVLIRRPESFSLTGAMEAYRSRIRTAVTRGVPEQEGSIIQAMLLGEQRQIPREVMEAFSRTGTTHIIAISGFNVGMVALFALLVVRPLLRSSEWLLLRGNVTMMATSAALLVVCFYTFVAGAGISVVRASLMVGAAMLALLWGRERDLFNTLALAALVILLADPASLFTVSFQLSFAAVAALLLWVPVAVSLLSPPLPAPVAPVTAGLRLRWLARKAGRGLVVFVLVTLAATLGTLPLILHDFNRLSLVTLAANLVAVPLLGVLATPVCLLILVATPLSRALTELLLQVAALLVRISVSLIQWMGSLPWSALYVPTPSVPEMTAYYLLLIAGMEWLRGRVQTKNPSGPPPAFSRRMALAKTVMAVSLAFMAVDAGLHWERSQHRGRLTLTAIDVGQGSSVLVRFPGGRRMLVDGGGFYDEHFDVGKLIVAPFLWKEGIARIDTVVLTHPHPDHLQGLLFVLAHFGVREAWTNGEQIDSPVYLAFRELLRERGVRERVLADDAPVTQIGGVTVAILNPASQGRTRVSRTPQPRSAPGTDKTNEDSLVLRLGLGRRSFLVTGDIGAATEARLLEAGRDLASDVLFVPHHGSLRSGNPLFLDRVHPQVAIVSCGDDNRFGFPHPEVIRRLKERGIALYRTDRDGAVICSTDGASLAVTAFRAGSR